MQVLFIPADSTRPFEIREITRDSATLRQLQAMVGGCIELVPLPVADVTLWCNEDGKGMQLPFNPRAQLLWQKLWPQIAIADRLLGDVFLAGGTDAEGDMQSVPETVVYAMRVVAYGR